MRQIRILTQSPFLSSLNHFLAQYVLRVIVVPMLLVLCLGGYANAAGGGDPFARAVAVNPVTNKVYISNTGSGTVTVLDGITGDTSTVNVGGVPDAIAVNPVTNKIYVTNANNLGVAVIDGASNAFTILAIPAGDVSRAIAVNPVTNKIYVVNTNSNGNVMVIDGATNNTVIVTDPNANNPYAVAINSLTNKIYVANRSSNNLTVLDGASNATTTVAAGTGPLAVTVNPQTNKIYVSDFNSTGAPGAVTVIDGASNTVTSQIPVGVGPFALAVNPVTNKIYVANSGISTSNSTVTVIDGSSNGTTSVPIGHMPSAVAVNPVNNQIYVANEFDDTVTVIDGTSNMTTTVAGGQNPLAVAVNPTTGNVYVADMGNTDVTVIGGATIQTASITIPNALPNRIGVNPVTNQIYMVGGDNDDTMLVIDGASRAVTQVAVGTLVSFIGGPLAVNQANNTVYAFNKNIDLTVIAGATSTQPATVISTIPLGISTSFPNDLAVNPATNMVYASTSDGKVKVIDVTAGNVIATISVGCQSPAFQVNPATNKIYVLCSYPGGITVIDGTSNTVVANIPLDGNPGGIAVNPVTNRIYVTGALNSLGGNLNVIDGASNAVVASIPLNSPTTVAVNPVNNRIYVSTANGMNVIDGASNTVVATIAGGHALEVAVNPVTNHLFFDGNDSNPDTVFAIDGISNTSSTVLTGNFVLFMAVNPATNQIYVGARDVMWVITEQQVQPVPLPVSIAFQGLPNINSTADPNPVFQFSAGSNFYPFSLPVQNVYFQVDTWQGAWQQATRAGTSFTGQLSSVSQGNHVLYAYATDGQNATLWSANSLTGPIAAFPFTVVQAALIPRQNLYVAPLPNTQTGNFNSTKEVIFVIQSSKPLYFNCSQMFQRTVRVNGILYQSAACDSNRGKSVKLPVSINGKYLFDVSAGNPSWASIAFWNQN